MKDTSGPSESVPPLENRLRLLHNHSFDSLVIECGEIDGVVLDTWMNINENSSALEVDDDDDAHIGYWAAAAIWFDAWDQRTVDRVSCFSVFFFYKRFSVLFLHSSADILYLSPNFNDDW
jgi:spatacsin